ncbi:unnamed protein product, partial [Brenthis ino]
MSPRCKKSKCLKRVPIYIPVHRPCLDSLHLPISRPCALPSFNVHESSYIQPTHPACHGRDQSCSVKICSPNDWIPSHPHVCKLFEINEDINIVGSEIDLEQSEQYKRLEENNLDDEFVQGNPQANSKDKYFEEKNGKVNEEEISSQLHSASTYNQTSNIQDHFAQRQPLPKMPINPAQTKSKTSARRIRNSRDDSRSNVRHVGSTVVPETRCKGIQVTPSSALHETGFFPQNQLNNVSRNKLVSERNGRKPYNDATYSYDNSRETLINRDNFNQPNVNRKDFYNERNGTLNPCCQSKYIQIKQRDLDLLNNRAQTSSLNNNIEYPRQNDVYPEKNCEYDRDERFIRSPQDTYGLGTSRPSANSPKEHIISMNRSPTEYTSAQQLMKASDTKGITTKISPVKSQEFANIQTGFNPVQNESERYTLNGKTYNHERNNSLYLNDLQPNERGSRERALRDIDEDNIAISPNQRQNVFQEKSCCKESAPAQKPVVYSPMMNPEIQKQKLQSKNRVFSETLTSGSRQGKGCCKHGISGLENKFRSGMGQDTSYEHRLDKFSTKNVECACTDKDEGKDQKCTKKTCDRDIGTISCASVACTANQGIYV